MIIQVYQEKIKDKTSFQYSTLYNVKHIWLELKFDNSL